MSKIIAIASMGDYSKSLPKSPIPFVGKWWLWLRYKFFGVSFNPKPEINILLSPSLQISNKRKEFSSENLWNKYINSKLFLFHAVNDKVIPYTNFKNNLLNCRLIENNWVVTKRGGHNFLKYELVIIASIIEALKRKKS